MKDFLLLANVNAVTYKEFFPLLKKDKARGGYNFNKTVMFETPEGEKSCPNIAWFTTLPTPDKKKLVLTKTYNPQDFQAYDNYDAINVDRVKYIPYDYDGVMGVPITFLGQYSPEQFEIIGFFNNYNPENVENIDGAIYGEAVSVTSTTSLFRGPVVNGKALYFRVLIRRKK